MEENKQDEPTKTYEKITEAFGKLFEEFGIKSGVVLFVTEQEKKTGIFYNNHFYEAAKLISQANISFKEKVAKELGYFSK